MQVVINTQQFGTFSISKKAIEYIQKKIKLKKDKQYIGCYAFDCDRSNPLVIEAIKKLKNEAYGPLFNIKDCRNTR